MDTKSIVHWVVFVVVSVAVAWGLVSAADTVVADVDQYFTYNVIPVVNETKNEPQAESTVDQGEKTVALMATNMGVIELELYPKEAPLAVKNFIKLATEGFYDGTRFHRVIRDFMIQGGDPLSKDLSMRARWGTGGPGYTFADEPKSSVKLVRGVLAMANAGPNTNGSQFFIITTKETPWLQGKHTGFGKVISGMDVVDKIVNAPTGPGDQPVQDAIIQKITIK